MTLTRPSATLSHPMGEGLGVRALSHTFMVPMNARSGRTFSINPVLVAQIFNLLCRRFGIGSASANSDTLDPADASQDAILRYGRFQICATPSSLWFKVSLHAGTDSPDRLGVYEHSR